MFLLQFFASPGRGRSPHGTPRQPRSTERSVQQGWGQGQADAAAWPDM